MRRVWAVLGLLAMGAKAPPRAEPFGPPAPPTPYAMCEAAVAAAKPKRMPDMLMPAISRVESGRLDAATGRVRPWPWTINVNGQGFFFETKEEAVATVAALRAKGTQSVDVGCMQVNLFFHPAAFASLDEAFDPAANAAYAARFLMSLYGPANDWPLAAAMYHSQTQELGEDYQRRVFGQVMTPMGPARQAKASPAAVFAAFAPAASVFAAIPPASTQFGAFAPAAAASAPVRAPFAKGQATARR